MIVDIILNNELILKINYTNSYNLVKTLKEAFPNFIYWNYSLDELESKKRITAPGHSSEKTRF